MKIFDLTNEEKVFIHKKNQAAYLLIKGEELLYTFRSKTTGRLVFVFFRSEKIESNLQKYEEIIDSAPVAPTI